MSFVLVPIGGTVTITGHQIDLRIAGINAEILFHLSFSSLAVFSLDPRCDSGDSRGLSSCARARGICNGS